MKREDFMRFAELCWIRYSGGYLNQNIDIMPSLSMYRQMQEDCYPIVGACFDGWCALDDAAQNEEQRSN